MKATSLLILVIIGVLISGCTTEIPGILEMAPTTATEVPTTVHTVVPTAVPTTIPTTLPTTVPTTRPTTVPTTRPTTLPTTVPTTVLANLTETPTPPGSFSILVSGGLGMVAPVYVINSSLNISPFYYDSYGQLVWSPKALRIDLPPDGHTQNIQIEQGNYVAYLPDRAKGVPEQQTFTVLTGYNTVVIFSGQSYRISR